jgi:hypothetical protein
MVQLDSLIVFSLLWSTLFVLAAHYIASIEILIPSFFCAKKFREKKLDLSIFFGFLNSTMALKFSYVNSF